MKVSDLLEVLKEQDQNCDVVVGKSLLLGGGLAASVEDASLYVTRVSNYIVIHSNDPKKPLHRGENLGVIVDFE